MISDLVLFCGGDPLYTGQKPKPLSIMPNALSMIETFFQQEQILQVSKITILAEMDFFDEYKKLIDVLDNNDDANLDLLATPTGSSTLEKINLYLNSPRKHGKFSLFTYPDIFYFGDWTSLLSSEGLDKCMKISTVPLQSRFSEITFNPYTQKIQALSLRPTRVPANKSHIYAGHFFGQTNEIRKNLSVFESTQIGDAKQSLEGEFFKFLISNGLLEAHTLADYWVKADSWKEMIEIVKHLEKEKKV
jgi:hypothetical protein